MAQATELTIRALGRSPWIVAGVLLLGIGIGDLTVGRAKLTHYQDTLSRTPVDLPRDPATLFPKATEAEEQRAVAQAKLGFYRLLFLAGQFLTLGGLVLLVIGVVQLRPHGEELPAGGPTPHSR